MQGSPTLGVGALGTHRPLFEALQLLLVGIQTLVSGQLIGGYHLHVPTEVPGGLGGAPQRILASTIGQIGAGLVSAVRELEILVEGSPLVGI